LDQKIEGISFISDCQNKAGDCPSKALRVLAQNLHAIHTIVGRILQLALMGSAAPDSRRVAPPGIWFNGT
jgi:hypothetical protein